MTKCLWCETAFTRRRGGGSSQRFCSAGCRKAFHSAARLFGEQAVACGALTVAALRNLNSGALTFHANREAAAEASELREACEASEKADAASRKFDELLGCIHDELSEDQLDALPFQVWDLMLYAFDFSRSLGPSDERTIG